MPYPDDFTEWGRNGKLVTETVAKRWPTAPGNLPLATSDDRLTLLVTSDEPTAEQMKHIGPGGVARWLKLKGVLPVAQKAALALDGVPPLLIMRFANVIPQKTCDIMEIKWDRLKAVGVRPPHRDARRSGTGAWHFGVWNLYGDKPRITGDSVQLLLREPQKTMFMEALDDLASTFKRLVLPKLERLMGEYVPEQKRVQDL